MGEKTFSRSDNAKDHEMTHFDKKHKMPPQMLAAVMEWANQNCNQIIESTPIKKRQNELIKTELNDENPTSKKIKMEKMEKSSKSKVIKVEKTVSEDVAILMNEPKPIGKRQIKSIKTELIEENPTSK